MGARAEAMARTRQQIIDAAVLRVRASLEPLALKDIAAHAGVSRATLYRHFGSVTDLLDGVAGDLLARARYDQLLAALELPDPVDALRQGSHQLLTAELPGIGHPLKLRITRHSSHDHRNRRVYPKSDRATGLNGYPGRTPRRCARKSPGCSPRWD